VIRFGTSGWRAVIAEEFTVANVRRVASAIARQVKSGPGWRRGVFIGYDTRFLSDRFAREAANVLAAHPLPHPDPDAGRGACDRQRPARRWPQHHGEP